MTDRFARTPVRFLFPLILSVCLLAACAGNDVVGPNAGTMTPPGTPDTTPPTVSSASPSNNATGVSTGAVVRVTFSEAMSAASINTGTFTVNGVSGSVSASGAVATFSPSSALASSTTFTAHVLGGASGVKDAAGNPLAADFTWTFTTADPLACASPSVHCVDVNPGPSQEFTTIQAAVNAAQAGNTVLVFDGTYAGFVVTRSGTTNSPITVKAAGSSAVINQVNSVGEGIRVSDASFVTIEGFTLTGLPAYGLTARDATPAAPMHGLIFRGNTVTNSGSTNIYVSEAADSLVEGNSTSNSGEHGIYLANGGSDNTILRGNHCFNNAVNGIHLNGDASIGPGGDGLHKGITIEKNVIHGNAANGLDLDGIQDSLIQNNLIYGNGNHAARAFQIDASAGPRNLAFVNNTFLQGNGNAVLKLTQDLGGHTFFNNILVNDSSGTSLVVGNLSFQSNDNIVRGGLSLDGESAVISLAQWQANGHDANSLASTSATLFSSPGTDFTLKSGAPAANAGVASFNSVPAPSADILGVARPKGSTFDIGAYESF